MPETTLRQHSLILYKNRPGRITQVGKKLELAAPPVFDGLISANGRLYMALMDGTVLCLGS